MDASPYPSTAFARIAAWLASRPGAPVAVVLLTGFGWILGALPAIQDFDADLLDSKFRLLRRIAPLHVVDDVVIIGIDEATIAERPEPIAVSHRMLADALTALAQVAPRAVGIDLVLPDRSYDAFAPGSDAALVQGLLRLSRVAPVILGVTSASDGRLRRIHPPLLAAANSRGDDLALFATDRAGRVRRFDDALGAHGERVSTLVGRMAATAGMQPLPGIVQYALGDGFDYVPMRDVLAWTAAGDIDELRRNFGDKLVLIGYVLPHEDRTLQPVALARWEHTLNVPGVVMHAQMLRTQLAGASVRTAPWPAELLLLALAASLWSIARWQRRLLSLATYMVVALLLSLVLLRAGIELPLGDALRVALVAVAARGALDAWRVRQERGRLRALFAGFVSPPVMQEILAGRIDGGRPVHHGLLCFLFADVKDFTSLCESLPPQEVVHVLNRYFETIAPVIHAHGGTIDNYRGDGVLAIFGAPNAIDEPCTHAIAAGREMFACVESFNRVLIAEGRPDLAIRVTLGCGDAVVGNVGANARFNYTAMGDAVNVAARLQDVARATGHAMVITDRVRAAATGPAGADWLPLGEVMLRGHSPVVAFAWDPEPVTSGVAAA